MPVVVVVVVAVVVVVVVGIGAVAAKDCVGTFVVIASLKL